MLKLYILKDSSLSLLICFPFLLTYLFDLLCKAKKFTLYIFATLFAKRFYCLTYNLISSKGAAI